MAAEVVEQLAEQDAVAQRLRQVEDLGRVPGHPVVGRQHLAADQPLPALLPGLHPRHRAAMLRPRRPLLRSPAAAAAAAGPSRPAAAPGGGSGGSTAPRRAPRPPSPARRARTGPAAGGARGSRRQPAPGRSRGRSVRLLVSSARPGMASTQHLRHTRQLRQAGAETAQWHVLSY